MEPHPQPETNSRPGAHFPDRRGGETQKIKKISEKFAYTKGSQSDRMNKDCKQKRFSIINFIQAFLFGWFTSRLDRLVIAVETHNQTINKMATSLDALIVQIERTTAVEASAVALIQDLAERLSEIATDPLAVQLLADQLKASADALAAAIAANTPAAPGA